MLNSSERYLQRQYYYELIQQLISKHTLKLWSLMCSLVLIIGALAVVGLLDPGFDPTDAQQNSSSSTLTTEQSQAHTARSRQRATAWKIALLMLGSTAGAWAIAYNLKNGDWFPKPSRQRVARAKVKRKAKSNLSRPSKLKAAAAQRPSRKPVQAAKRVPAGTRSLQPQALARNNRTLPAQPVSVPQRSVRPQIAPQPRPTLTARDLALPPRAVGEEPTITVVPAETVMPLDRREPTLAELMDLRKRHPITAIMGGTKKP
jgi:hypothetical protein